MTTAANSLTYRHWSDLASCRGEDPELFYPEGDQPDKEARRICLTCPVREQCLEHALKHDERFGIWGGLPAKERQQVKGQMAGAPNVDHCLTPPRASMPSAKSTGTTRRKTDEHRPRPHHRRPRPRRDV